MSKRDAIRHEDRREVGWRGNLALVLALALTLFGATGVALPASAVTAQAEESTAAADAQQVSVNVKVIGPSAQGFFVPWYDAAESVDEGATALDAVKATDLTEDGQTFTYSDAYNVDEDGNPTVVTADTAGAAYWKLLVKADGADGYTEAQLTDVVTSGEDLLWYYEDGTTADEGQATITIIGPNADGDDSYYLNTTTVDVTAPQSAWDTQEATLAANGLRCDASETQYGQYVSGFTDVETGNSLASMTDYTAADYKYWGLYVNGVSANYGISSVYLRPGDSVTWYYGAYGAALPEADTIKPTTVTMYRLYNQWSGEHLFTEDRAEVDNLVSLGWTDEGNAWKAPKTSSAPIYRLYNQYNGEHLYTTDKSEYDARVADGWTGEGIKAYSDDAEGVTVYRLFNPYETVGTHHYTTDESEYDARVADGWSGEGAAFYGVA